MGNNKKNDRSTQKREKRGDTEKDVVTTGGGIEK